MKIYAVALYTVRTLARNKLIILFCCLFACVLMMVASPLGQLRSRGGSQAEVLFLVSVIVVMTSGFGSLLAAWAATEAVSGEIRSGTILAILARPVHRWQFLAGKHLGVMLLMAVYAALMCGLTYLMVAIGGQRVDAPLWALLAYPLARYAIYAALAIVLVTRMHAVLAFAAVMIASVALPMFVGTHSWMPEPIWNSIYAVLPSMGMLDETDLLDIAKTSLHPIPWTQHVTAVLYGLNYATLLLIVAVWLFRGRELRRG